MKGKNKNVGIKLVKGVPTPDITVSSFNAAIKSANNPKRLRQILMALRKIKTFFFDNMTSNIIEYAGVLWLEASNPNVDIYLNHGDKKYIQLKPWLELALNVEIYYIHISDDKTSLVVLVSSQIKLNDLNSIFIDLNNVVIGCYEDEGRNMGVKLIINLKE